MAMTDGTADRIRIEVSDFGPVGDAAFDLRPLTIFLGPSNAGKSYLALLIHALHQYGVDRSTAPHMYPIGQSSGSSKPLYLGEYFRSRGKELPPDMRKLFRDWVVHESGSDTGRFSKLPPAGGLTEYIGDAISESYRLDQGLKGALLYTFGVDDVGELCRRHSTGGGTTVTVSATESNGGKSATLKASLARSELQLDLTMQPHSMSLAPSPDSLEHTDLLRGFFRSYETILAMPGGKASTERDRALQRQFGSADELLDRAFAQVCLSMSLPISPLFGRAHFLPSNRTGIMQAHSVFVSALVSQASRPGGRGGHQTSALSGVLAEFLTNILYTVRRDAPYAEIAGEIEAEILHGTIDEVRDPMIDYPTFFYRPDKWGSDRLPLLRTSSMVAELAPIVLYLRRVIGAGELLVIEEPEVHLHPAMQVRLAFILARLVKAGLKVLIITHSEWLLEQFSNLVRLSDLPPEQREDVCTRYPNLRAAMLSRDQAGAWEFQSSENGDGSTVREYPLGNGQLALPKPYEQVMYRLYDEWQAIDSHICELNEGQPATSSNAANDACHGSV